MKLPSDRHRSGHAWSACAGIDTVDALSIDELLRDAGDGCQYAWAELVRRYGPLVWARVRSFPLQESDAHDAVQLTWLRLFENCHRVRFPERITGWLATTARRECLRILRRTRYTVDLTEAVDDVADPSADPEQHVIDTESAQLLRGLVAELSPRRRALLRALFADSPVSYTQVARVVGIPPGSIGPTRARTLQQLRQMIEDRGLRSSVA